MSVDPMFIVGLPLVGFTVTIVFLLLQIGRQLEIINIKLDQNKRRDLIMSKELDDLTTEVSENSAVIDSAVLLIEGIAARVTAAGVDPAKLQALTNELNAKSEALAAAVQANTPAESIVAE